jgi:hypothetical protein
VRALRLSGLAVALPLLAVALLSGCGGSGPAPPAPRRPAGDLVFMKRLQPITMIWQSAAVRADGTGVTSDFVGERSLVKRPVRLGAAALGHLRRAVGRVRGPVPHARGRPPRTAMVYTVRLGGRALVAVGGHIPRPLAPIVRSLNRVIDR